MREDATVGLLGYRRLWCWKTLGLKPTPIKR